MNKSLVKGSLLVLSMGISCGGWAFGPCMPIAKACMQQGGYTNKQTMIKECVLPVVQGQRTLPNTNFSPMQLQQCQLALKQKMQQKLQQKMGSM